MGVSACVDLPLHHKVHNACGVVVVLSTKIAVQCCQKSVSIQGVKAQRVAKHAGRKARRRMVGHCSPETELWCAHC